MALNPVKPRNISRSPLQRPVGGAPFAPAYVQKTKSNSGLWIFLLLVLAGGAFYYVYTHQETPVADNTPKVIVVGNPDDAARQNSDDQGNLQRPKKTAMGTVGARE